MIELSMSMLSEFQRCRRKWYYHYGLGLESKEAPDYIGVGSAFHAAVAEGFKLSHDDRNGFLAWAAIGLANWQLHTEEGRRFNPELNQLVCDMVEYWWQHEGQYLKVGRILAVEEHIPLKIGKYSIRCTPDLVVMQGEKIVVIDHKTVGDIKDSLAFLPLDFQLRCYALTVWDRYGQVPEVAYNMVRRELPPDFERADGTRPYGLTKTGRKSTRSCDPADYVRYERMTFTQKQLMAFADNLEADIHELEDAIAKKQFGRSVIKGGAIGCGGCPYLASCTRELDGENLDAITLSLEFNRRPDALFVPEKAA